MWHQLRSAVEEGVREFSRDALQEVCAPAATVCKVLQNNAFRRRALAARTRTRHLQRPSGLLAKAEPWGAGPGRQGDRRQGRRARGAPAGRPRRVQRAQRGRRVRQCARVR